MSGFFSYLNWFQIVLLMVAFMSGVLSIIRELVLIYRPDEIREGFLFWRCVIIAFVLSSFALWITEHHQTLVLQAKIDQLSLPNLGGKLGFAIAPSGSTSQDSVITINGMITNAGAPSIAYDWSADLNFRDGHVIHGKRVVQPGVQAMVTLLQDLGPPITLSGASHWDRTATMQPIPTGGAAPGWIQFVFSGTSDKQMQDDGAELVFSFTDINGKRWFLTKKVMAESNPLIFPQSIMQSPDIKTPPK